jgi:signal transduction histidine kinase
MFYKARIKLTLWYVGMIMVVSLIFSTAIYQLQLNELKLIESRQRTRIYRQLEIHNMGPIILELNFIDEVKKNLIVNLLYLNGVIFVMSGICAWILSGKTLGPIHAMVIEQSRFISDASHELNTPLTSLKTAFEVFNRSKKKTLHEASNIINDSLSEVQRLQKLAESLLQLAQFQAPLSGQVFESASLNTLVKETIEKTAPLAQKKSIKISSEGASISAEVIPDEIAKLVYILLENAIKYSPKKSTILLSLSASRADAILKIRDEGVGIAEQDVPHIFDRFYRADVARMRTDVSGYGLGLSIAQSIVKKHRGTIRVESTIDKGSTFTVRIPKKHLLS